MRIYIKILTLLLFLIPSLSYAGNDGITIEDISRLQEVHSAELSGDGQYIAYQVSKPHDPREENKSPEQHLYIYNTETGESVAYHTGSDRVRNVRFRPGHETVTFIKRVPEGRPNALYEMPLTGGEAQIRFRFRDNIRHYEWAGDGEMLAFTARPQQPKEEDNGLPYSGEVFEEDLRNIKGYIATLHDDDFEANEIQTEGTIYKLSWSPDQDKLAISVAPTPLVDHELMFQSVKVTDLSGEIIADIDNEGKLNSIHWSPDGDKLALLAGHNIHDPIAGRIMITSAEGGTPENIYPEYEGKFESIRWTGPETIHFIGSESTERRFGTINPDNGEIEYISEEDGFIMESFSYRNDDDIAFLAHTHAHPAEVYHWQGDGDFERVTFHNKWLNDRQLGEQSVIQYNASDGKELEGILVLPVGYEDGSAVPLLVEVHGGPEAHEDNGWLTDYRKPGQEAAAKGYAIFYPNYRGSTGRGIDFIKTSQGDAAGAEFDDVVDGVDHLIEAGIADPDRVGITGSSYGGYATAWMATYYSERFAAAVMNVGVSNKLSKWGTSDIPEELYLVHSREWLWEENNWQKYLERSPIYHVDNAQTPIKITHGAEDTRVHPGQSMELYRHLSVRKPDLPVRFVQYPGEGHSYHGATAKYEHNIRMFRWFDAFLLDDGEVPPVDIE